MSVNFTIFLLHPLQYFSICSVKPTISLKMEKVSLIPFHQSNGFFIFPPQKEDLFDDSAEDDQEDMMSELFDDSEEENSNVV